MPAKPRVGRSAERLPAPGRLATSAYGLGPTRCGLSELSAWHVRGSSSRKRAALRRARDGPLAAICKACRARADARDDDCPTDGPDSAGQRGRPRQAAQPALARDRLRRGTRTTRSSAPAPARYSSSLYTLYTARGALRRPAITVPPTWPGGRTCTRAAGSQSLETGRLPAAAHQWASPCRRSCDRRPTSQGTRL